MKVDDLRRVVALHNVALAAHEYRLGGEAAGAALDDALAELDRAAPSWLARTRAARALARARGGR